MPAWTMRKSWIQEFQRDVEEHQDNAGDSDRSRWARGGETRNIRRANGRVTGQASV